MKNNTVINSNYSKNFVDSYERRQIVLRQSLLDQASFLLVHKGPQALSMRHIAQAAGCSTMVLYTLFGSKQGLVNELYLKGFSQLSQALEAVPHLENPLEYLLALGRAYRIHALANPTYYTLMFGQLFPEFTPSPESLHLSRLSFKILVQTVSECIKAEIFSLQNPEEIAKSLWASVHGHVGLELSGHFNQDRKTLQQRFERTMLAVLTGFRRQEL